MLRIVLLYQVLVYLFFGLALYASVLHTPGARAVVDSSAAKGSCLYFAAFHIVTAYNNCGFALQQDSFSSLQQVSARKRESAKWK